MQLTLKERIRIGDPCYEDFSNNSVIEYPAIPGLWLYRIEYEKGMHSCCNQRVMAIEAIAKGHSPKKHIETKLPVDSGQMAIESSDVVRGGEVEESGYYGDACNTTLGEKHYGVFKQGDLDILVSSTGYGDGNYPVELGFTEDDKLCSIRITFSEEAEEDDCEYCGVPPDYCMCQDDNEDGEDDD